jgi:hypothetical protein
MASERPRKRARPCAAITASGPLDGLDSDDNGRPMRQSSPLPSTRGDPGETVDEHATGEAASDYRDQAFYEPVKFGEFVSPATLLSVNLRIAQLRTEAEASRLSDELLAMLKFTRYGRASTCTTSASSSRYRTQLCSRTAKGGRRSSKICAST